MSHSTQDSINMFEFTSEESAILNEVPALEAERKNLAMQLRFLSPGDEQSQLFQKVSELTNKVAELQKSELYAVAELKKTANDLVNTKLPFPPGAALTIAEQLFPIITDSPSSIRVQALMKNLVLRLMQNIYDADLLKARAQGLKSRYDAMLDTGLSEDFVQKLLIAEASRPISVSPSYNHK